MHAYPRAYVRALMHHTYAREKSSSLEIGKIKQLLFLVLLKNFFVIKLWRYANYFILFKWEMFLCTFYLQKLDFNQI